MNIQDYPKKIIKTIKEKGEKNTSFFEALSPEDKKIHKGRKDFIVDYVAGNIVISITAGSYLAGLLNYAGIPPQINGIVLSIPVLLGIFQIFGAIISQRLRTQKKFVLFGIAAHRLCFSLLFMYPFIFGPTILCALMIVGTYAVGYFFSVSIGPAASNWLVSLVPEKIRGDFFSKRERYILTGVALSSMLVSLILDKAKIYNYLATGYAIIGIFLIIVSFVDIYHVSRIYEPETVYKKQKFTFKALIEPILDKKYFKVISILILWQACVQISNPFMGIYYVRSIKIDYTLIGIVILLATIEKAIVVRRWGKFADKTSWENVLKITVAIYATSQATQIFLSTANFLWLYPMAQLIGNVALSALGISLFNIQFSYLKFEKAVIYIAVGGTVSCFFGFGFALIGSKILTLVNNAGIGFNGNQVLIFISSLIGFTLSLYIHRSFRKDKNIEPN
ncbi:MAG: MFS transporter [Saccharofermentanales bacterium]